MSVIKQTFTTLSPQPSLTAAGTPERLSTTSITVRSVLIEAAKANTDDMYVSDSEAKASTVNRHKLAAGDSILISVDQYADSNAFIDIRDIWFDGEVNSEKLVVSYLLFVTNPGGGVGQS